MPKQINVKLGFEADTKQAKAQIADLQKSLDNLMNSSIKNSATTGFDAQISKAQQSVLKLKTAIDNSLNADTGRLDLSKFNQQLNNSGMSLTSLSKDMNNLGVDGQKAFLNLANSIVTAQKPMVESNKLLDNMWTALKNTARWQLSSSILHGFMGALQGAYGYAQDLNRSLTDIAIVTGRSVDQMAAFAEQANKSAQALSVSTTAYTDAALIYYQQGLNDEEVKARTDITMQMSNVTRESAEHVSSYMTAIWNNFADGSSNLAHFADVITALGAATASSSEEIANGMQQFAAVADTVGLSYEYAATALATVVAQTRQSESTVGNSFRTIFSRLQGLQLGETLEDGTDLNKYSKALMKVGVDIKDQNGDLKDMNTILDEIGAKWQSLAKDQQIALAQTVGGVRQYTNLVALFDNWDKFQENLQVANGSDGTLQKQADIYAQSWEAAQKRVRAAWQALYQDLIDDKFFIGLANGFSDILGLVDKLIDSIGGLPGVLSLAGAAFTSIFGNKLTGQLQNVQLQLGKVLKPIGSKKTYAEIDADNQVEEVLQAAINSRVKKIDKNSINEDFIIDNLKQQISYNKALRDLKGEISKQDYTELENLIKISGEYAEQAQRLEDIRRKQELKTIDTVGKARDMMNESGIDRYSEAYLSINAGLLQGEDKVLKQIASNSDINSANKQIDELVDTYANWGKEAGLTREIIRALIKDQVELKKVSKEAGNAINAQWGAERDIRQKLGKELKFNIQGRKTKAENIFNDSIENISLLNNKKDSLNKIINDAKKDYENLLFLSENGDQRALSEAQEKKEEIEKINAEIEKINAEIEQKIKEATDAANRLNNTYKKRDEKAEESEQSPEVPKEIKKKPFFLTPEFSEGVTQAVKGVSQVTMGITSLSTAVKILNDEDMGSPFERITKALPSLLIGFPALLSGFKTLGVLIPGVKIALDAANGSLITFFTTLFTQPHFWIFVAIATTIAGVVVAIKSATDAWNADAKAAEKAKEAAKKAKEEYENTKTAFDELKSTLENHNKGIEALEDLKKGTAEWREEVRKLNNELLDVITKYPELAQYIENTDGVLTLNEEGQQGYLNKQYKELQSKLFESIQSNDVNLSSGIDSKATNLARKIAWDNQIKLDISSDALQALVKKASEDNSILESAESIKEALSDQYDIASDVAYAFFGNADKIKELSDEFHKGVLANNSQLEAFTAANIENELGGDISTALGSFDAEGYSSAIKDYLQERILRDFNSAEEQTSETFFNILQDARTNFDNNTQEIIKNALQDKFSNIAQTMNDNVGANAFDTRDIQEYFNNLSDKDKKLFFQIDFDKAKSTENLDEQLSDLREKLRNTPIDIDATGLSKKKTAELEAEFESLTNYIYENADAIKELDDHLIDCKREASQVAAAIIRFDDAIQDVTENYDDWNKALKSGSMQRATKAAVEMRDTYADLLNIDGSTLSDDFLRDVNNLELMKQAINGSGEAYDKLLQKAGEDILVELGIDKSLWEQDKKWIQDEIFALTGQKWDDIKIGADLNNEEFLRGLTDIVNAAGMTAEQATAYLASMGIDAEVETEKVENPVTKTVNSLEPEITTGGVVDVPTIGAENPLDTYQVPIPRITYTAKPEQIVDENTGSGFTLKVTSAHKSSGGNFKYKQASHGGGGKKSGSGGGKKGGGGGGGGGSKKKEVKQPKEHVKKEDRYHDLKEQLDDVQKAYDKVNKSKDRAFGLSKLKYLDKEIDKLKEEDKLLKQYVKEIESYAKKDLADLMSLNIGAQFDDTGKLLNYEAVLKRIVDDQNAAIDKFNAAQEVYNKSAQSDSDKEILEAAQKELEAQEKVAKDREEKLKQYNDTYNLWQDQVWAELQKRWEIYDKNLEQVTLKAEIQLDFNEHDLELLEFYFDNLGDGVDKATDKIANLNKQMGIYEDNLDIYREGISGIFKNHGIDVDLDNMNPDQLLSQLRTAMTDDTFVSELTDEEGKQLQEFTKGLMENIGNIKDKLEEVHEVVSDTFDKWHENLQDAMHDYEKLNKLLDHNRKIIELTGKDYLKISDDMMRQMDQQAIKVAQDMTTSSKQIADSLAQQAADAKANWEHYLSIGDEVSAAYWEEHYKEFNEAAEDALDEYRSNFENSLELTNQAFENSLDRMEEAFKNAFGDMGIDYILDRFDRQKELDELYLPEFKKFNELNKATKELDKSLQKTNNNIIKGKMNDLMGEINDKMISGVKMSETEAEIIAKRVALLQAEDQLLAARQAKSAVRMTRDNEGNFSYTYTADQDAIGDAESAYAQQFTDLLELERNASDELQSRLLQKYSEFSERAAEIARKYYNSDREKYNKEMSDLLDEYNTFINYYVDQQDMLFGEMARLRDNDWRDFERVYELKLATEDDFITRMEDSILGRLVPSYHSAQDVEEQWKDASTTAIVQINDAMDQWVQNTEESFEAAGENVDTYGQKVVGNIQDIGTKSDETKEKVSGMIGDMETGMKKVTDAAVEMDNQWGKSITDMINKNGGLIASINELLKKINQISQDTKDAITDIAKAQEDALKSVAAASQAATGAVTGGSGSGGGGSGNKTGKDKTGGGSNNTYVDPKGIRSKTTVYNLYKDHSGTDYSSATQANKAAENNGLSYYWAFVKTERNNGSIEYGPAQKRVVISNEKSNWFKGTGANHGGSMMMYDTGGYTGDWGSSNGRLAILHQKEIVLNKDDTKNLLKSVDIIRNIKDLFQTKVSMGNINYNVLAGAGAGELQQQVHIDASFPNVTDHNEIELALNNLVNSTTQYINRRRVK